MHINKNAAWIPFLHGLVPHKSFLALQPDANHKSHTYTSQINRPRINAMTTSRLLIVIKILSLGWYQKEPKSLGIQSVQRKELKVSRKCTKRGWGEFSVRKDFVKIPSSVAVKANSYVRWKTAYLSRFLIKVPVSHPEQSVSWRYVGETVLQNGRRITY